ASRQNIIRRGKCKDRAGCPGYLTSPGCSRYCQVHGGWRRCSPHPSPRRGEGREEQPPALTRTSMQPLLVTGRCGFIGSNFIRYLLEADPAVRVINFDLLTYAGNLANLADLANHPRYRFVQGDIADPVAVGRVGSEGLDGIINFAAESHVDRSILDS